MARKKYLDVIEYLKQNVIPNMTAGEKLPPEKSLAAAAGVSVLTVRRSIEELCKQGMLSRVPEHRAVLPVSVHSSKICRIAIIRTIQFSYYSELLLELQQALLADGRFYPVFMDVIVSNNSYLNRHDKIMHFVQTNDVDAVLVIQTSPDCLILEKRLMQNNIPLISILGMANFRNAINIDYASGCYHTMRFLHECGHRSIWFVGHDAEQANEYSQGAKRFFRDYYPQEQPESRLIECLGVFDAGYKVFAELSRQHPDLDAIVTHNDLLAAGIITAAKERGVPIPEQISVVGGDDLEKNNISPVRLSSISVPVKEIAAETINALRYIFRNGVMTSSINIVLQSRLYLRDSVRFRF